jgi:hypothetical protein
MRHLNHHLKEKYIVMTISTKNRSELILTGAHELRQFAHDIEQGDFKGPMWNPPNPSLPEPVKTEVEIRDRAHQLKREYMDRVETRLKVSPDMLDQAQVLRQAANDLEAGIIDCDEVRSVLSAFAYADGLDYRYRRFLKDRKEQLFDGRRRKESAQ